MVQTPTITDIERRASNLLRTIVTILGLLEIREVASCTFYNANTFSFEHWNCPKHQICCIYYGAKSCCRERQAYMNTGYEHGGDHGNHHGSLAGLSWPGKLLYYIKTHYSELLAVLSMLFVLVMVIICCLQWKKRIEEEAEEEELMRINQMIAMSEGRSPGGSLYRPQPLSPLRHGEEPSENTTIASQQPPSYDSITKDENNETSTSQEASPPPPYKP